MTVLARWFFGLFFDAAVTRSRLFGTSALSYKRLLRAVLWQRLLGVNRKAPWPMSHTSTVSDYSRLHFQPDDLNNLQSPGCYFQNFAADITLGRGCYIAPNVGIITANHDPRNLDEHLPGQPVTLGDGCWVGMNSVILPGVVLGPGTVVGAGSVVTRSFPEGRRVIAGNPARVVRLLA